MTRETKVGLLMVVMLVGVFGFMVYKNLHRPSEAMAEQNREVVAPENETEVLPFAGIGDNTSETASGTGRIVTAGAAAPEAIPDNTAAVRVETREADPFAVPERSDVKPKLPTSVSGDDAFFDAQPKETAAVEPPASDAESSAPAAAFDPFMQESTSSSRTSVVANPSSLPTESPSETSTESSGKSPSVADTDPFEAPLEVGSSATPSAVQSAPADDPFEAPSQIETPPRTTTFSEPTPNLAPPPETAPKDAFDFVEEPKQTTPPQSVPALSAPTFESDTTSSQPSPLPTPTPKVGADLDDERLDGFRPVDVNARSTNEFAREARSTPAAIPATDPFGAARRPAPAARIDEDFAPRATTQALIPGETYNIEPSDNFWTISRKKYGTGRYFMALSQHNLAVIPDPKRMKPGVTISTPATDVLEKNYPTLIPKAAPAESVESSVLNIGTRRTNPSTDDDAGFFVSNEGVPMYRVGSEDTLSGIAQSHLGRSSRWVQIFEMNRDTLTDGNTLKVGTLLRLPGDASRVDVVGTPRAIR